MIDPFSTPGPAGTPVHGFPLPPETRQFRPSYSRGRYVDGEGRTSGRRVSSLASKLDNTSGLSIWQQRNVARGLAMRPELLERVDLADDAAALNRVLDDVVEQSSNAAGGAWAREFGTAAHAWCEYVDLGIGPVEHVPPVFRRHVQAYLSQLAAKGIRVAVHGGEAMIERWVRITDADFDGTFDRLYELPDGRLVVGDIKTSKRLSTVSIAIQLRMYAAADLMRTLDGVGWVEMPAVDQTLGLVLWIPSDADPPTCEAVTYDLAAGEHLADLALDVDRQTSAARGRIERTIKLPPPDRKPGDVPSLRELVVRARSMADLGELWQAYSAVWTDELTQLGRDAVAAYEEVQR